MLAVPADHPLAVDRRAASTSSVLAGEHVLLLEEGHCLRDQALDGLPARRARPSARGFRATSLETLRQMVAAGVGVTLLPELAVQPPVPPSDDVRLLRFARPGAPPRDRDVLAQDERVPRLPARARGAVPRPPAGLVQPPSSPRT